MQKTWNSIWNLQCGCINMHQYGKGSEVFGDLDSPRRTFHSCFLTSLLHLCCTLLRSSPGARTRMFVPGECCPTSVWPLLQPHPVLFHSVLMQTMLGCCYQQSLFGSTAVHPAVAVYNANIRHLAFQTSTETDAAGISTGVETWDILSQWVSFTKRGRGPILALLPCHLSPLWGDHQRQQSRQHKASYKYCSRPKISMEMDCSKAEIQFAVR